MAIVGFGKPGGGAGPGGVLPAGTAQGQILQWDIVLGEWVFVGAPNADGQVLVWDAATSEWVARQVQTWSISWGATQIPATAVTYLLPGGVPTSSGASTATQVNGVDVATRAGFIRRLTIIHQTAGAAAALVYTAQIELANSLVTVALNANVAGEAQDAVNVAPIANMDRIGIRVDNPVPTLTTLRILARLECFGFV